MAMPNRSWLSGNPTNAQFNPAIGALYDVVSDHDTRLGSTTAAEISYVHGVTSNVQTQLNALAPKASPMFTKVSGGGINTGVGGINVSGGNPAMRMCAGFDDAAGVSYIEAWQIGTSTMPLYLQPSGGLTGIGGIVKPITDNAYTLGASGARWSQIWSANATIQTSDLRAKNTITDSALGLDFINKLRPVSYKFNVGNNDVELVADGTETVTINEAIENDDGTITPAVTEERVKFRKVVTPVAGKRTHYGLIAQEVKSALGNTDFGGYVYDPKTDAYGLRYEEFISPLIKAVQELTARVAELEGRK